MTQYEDTIKNTAIIIVERLTLKAMLVFLDKTNDKIINRCNLNRTRLASNDRYDFIKAKEYQL